MVHVQRLAVFGLVAMAMSSACAASAQCYQFSATPAIYTSGGTGGPANVTLNLTNLPAPTIVGVPGSDNVSYTWVGPGNSPQPLAGSSVGLTVAPGTSYPSELVELVIVNHPTSTTFTATLSVSVNGGTTNSILTLSGPGNLLPNGLAAMLPPVSVWTAGGISAASEAFFSSGLPGAVSGSNADTEFTSITSCSVAKSLGYCAPCAANADHPGEPGGGDPITIGTGNLFEEATDYTSAGQNPLSFTRYYNSLGGTFYSGTFATTLGVNWRGTYDSYLHITPATGQATSVVVERADGQVLNFALNGSSWTTDTDVDATLTQSGSTWTLTDRNDTVFIYTANSTGEGMLNSITLRNGYTQNLAYSGNQLQTVTDSYGRKLGFSYASNGTLETVTTPDSLVLTYGFTAATGGNQLTSVSYNTSPVTSQTYVYENSAVPFALTGIIDENNNRFATWTYNTLGQGLTSQHGTGTSTADLTTLTYNSNATTAVTNALGVADTYTFTTLQGVPKVTQINRAPTSTTAAATETFSYDSNGYVASKTDWNGDVTNYVNDIHGDPTTINEAVGTSAARTTTIAYDSTWVHLPDSITTPGLTTSFTYDSSGEQLTRTLSDTTTATAPYSTNGQTRTWTNTWSNSLLASVKTPNGNTTKYGYDGTGALTSTTDALSHVTNITAHNGGGLPETIVDPNNVTTTLTYDPRLRLTSSTVSGTSGTYKTTWAYDAAGNLITTALPDNSYLTNAYDTAHRLIKVTDALGNYSGYTLDALGDRTQTNIYKSGGTLTWQDSGTFDALGRELVDTAGAGQTTTRTYDPNGNVLTVQDGLSHTTTNTYDALNRLSTSTDANAGVTTPSYDSHDRIISVADTNSNTTSYIRDGFGDVIQLTSPDSGIAVFHYDADANFTSKTDALGIVTNQTFDALDRPLTTTYPADTAENVAYTYDQTGTSFGVGRLTSVTDAAGSLTRAYEERGNLSAEARTNGNTTLTTGYTYDGANRVASMTYPDGTLVTYQHDAAGYLATVSAKPSGSTATTTIATLSHQPFGPPSAVTYGNGIAETWAYDNSYRPTNITDALSSANLQDLTYAYDNANNVKSITDAVNAANDQTLGYDVINRLTSAASGTGGYGSLSWTYDKVGNRLTQVEGATTASYGYATGTNRLSSITTSTAMGLLNALPKMRPRNGTGLMFLAHAPPNASQTPRRPQPSKLVLRPSQILTGFLGWPLLMAGFAGVIRFRKRLRSHRLLVVLSFLALLTGIGRLLNGCGGGSTGSSTQTPTASTPTFSPAGGTYTAAQSVTISDVTTGATIYYTADGSTPTTNSTKFSGAIMVPASETINAIAVASGYTNSAVGTATYTISIPQAATPTFSPVAGTYTAAQAVTISDGITGTSIYYTADGTTPTTSSTLYTKSITVSVSQTINAIAVASGYTNSAVGTAAYVLNIPTATPTFSPGAGTYTAVQIVTISDATTGASVYYTTNGATPTTSSTLYTTPITVSASETITAIAVASGYTNSATASAAYIINLSGIISTLAGNGTVGFSGDGGAATSAEINFARHVAIDISGNLYIADTYNNRVRKVTPGGIITTVAGNGTLGYSGDGSAATSAELAGPWGIATDAIGNLYIADAGNMRVRMVTPAGVISTVAGNGTGGFSGDGGAATGAELLYPYGVVVDSSGNLYIADSENQRIRKVTAAGIISTIAGNGTAGYSGDGGAATSAELNYPSRVAADSSGNVYIADLYNNRVREVTPGGIISTVAGNGTAGYSGDGGAATSAELNNTFDVAVDSNANLYIADGYNQRIRKVTPAGIISTVAGDGTPGYNGDGGAATSAELYSPEGVAVDSRGNLYIADYQNQRIRKVTYQSTTPQMFTPAFMPAAGNYMSALTVTVSDATAGAAIYFTTNGSTPTTSSTLYTGPITVSSSETIEAIAVASGYTNSAVATASYVINISLPTAATPTLSPGTGTYTAAQTVAISDATAGAAVYYTTDGTTPMTSSTPYSGPITVSSTETIEAIATASGDANSAIATATYTINISTGGSVTVITNANGNITSIPPADSSASATFSYNNANRPASVTGSPLAATFVYDWEGQRFSKTDNGETPSIYSYAQGGTLIAENDGGTTTDYIYADGRPIAILQPNATIAADQVNYVTADRLGTPQVVSNSGGTPVWSTTYQPFGSTGLINASISQNLRFPGQYADVETGFSYNLNRDYMPNLGRFLESDPVGLLGGLNTYTYARANPVRFKDRLGLDEENEQGDADIVAGEFDFAFKSAYSLRLSAKYYPPFKYAVPALELAEQTAGAASVGSYSAAAVCEPGSADAQAKRYAQMFAGIVSIDFPEIGIPLGAALDFREQQAEQQALREGNEEQNRESGIAPPGVPIGDGLVYDNDLEDLAGLATGP